ncbi:COP9 signalosome-like protein complex subunit 1 [Bisporella sp. PMI_857]|nr:COP9 signalosome-like protein complex subunit 1 [Bisporella sp. PMI_857]
MSSSKKKSIVVSDPPKFDLEAYIQNYHGRTRLERLLLIGNTSTFLAQDALKLAVAEAKAGRDVRKYVDAVADLSRVAPNEPEAYKDKGWIETTEKKNAAEAQRLEAELKGYKNNLIKESVRMGNEELGLFYQATGDLARSYEAYSRMRQDVSIGKHIIDIGRHLIEVAIEQKNWVAVSTNIQKLNGAHATPEEEKNLQPFVSAASGLAQMDAGEYYKAARSFLNIDPGMGSSCNTIISPNDIAVYGGLCALASMDRNEITTRVLENSNFRTYLELEPHIRKAISFFVNSRYSACLNVLESYRSDYLLDIYLQKHLDDLYYMVRSKSIVQYFIPFSCVTLDSLNAAFAAPGKSIEKELAKMIERKELDGRIDTQNRLLTSVPAAPRATLHSDALKTARLYEQEALLRIQQMNIVAADLEVRSKGKGTASLDDAFNQNDTFTGSFGAGGRNLRSRAGFQ